MRKKDEFVYYSGESWGALYQNGELVRYGDHYYLGEYFLSYLGVEEIMSEDFLRGGNTKEDVAKTLEEIDEWRQSIDGADWSDCLFEFKNRRYTLYVPFDEIDNCKEKEGAFTGRVIDKDHQLKELKVVPSFLK